MLGGQQLLQFAEVAVYAPSRNNNPHMQEWLFVYQAATVPFATIARPSNTAPTERAAMSTLPCSEATP